MTSKKTGSDHGLSNPPNSSIGNLVLDDHEQIKTALTGPTTSIEEALESGVVAANGSNSKLPMPPQRRTSPRNELPRTKDSFSHDGCMPSANELSRVVATIFYNTTAPRAPASHVDVKPPQVKLKNFSELSPPSIAPGSAPTTSLSQYPLEPPTSEPEPHDFIYGHFISPTCLNQFITTIEPLLGPVASSARHHTSSYRCLTPSSNQPRVVEVVLAPPKDASPPSLSHLNKHESIYIFEREWNCEVILQRESIFRRHKRLCVFDMDSTLIEQEVIDEIAAHIDIQDQVSSITARAMSGELDFAASLKERVTLLRGCSSRVFEELRSRITIAPGARELCTVLKRLGFTLAVISGGFQPLADWLAAQLGLDYAFANHLVIDPKINAFTGELNPDHPIVDADRKQVLLKELAANHQIPLTQTMAVGDGANDIPMLRAAGLGVAWNAKSKVQLEAPTRLNVGKDMLDLVHLLGLTRSEIDELLAESSRD